MFQEKTVADARASWTPVEPQQQRVGGGGPLTLYKPEEEVLSQRLVHLVTSVAAVAAKVRMRVLTRGGLLSLHSRIRSTGRRARCQGLQASCRS